ncbi:hypothetical protein niasHT_034051 [Heterodera trifolii]|uniref:Uncharacterized protein n=1 Tax=Heterodera trifolii TaxID=157864 RepID=A0ABD2I7H7_9BILA
MKQPEDEVEPQTRHLCTFAYELKPKKTFFLSVKFNGAQLFPAERHAHHEKTVKMSTRNTNMFGVMRELVNSKGLGALFTGAVPRVARVAPACAVMIGCYEELKQFFARKNRSVAR